MALASKSRYTGFGIVIFLQKLVCESKRNAIRDFSWLPSVSSIALTLLVWPTVEGESRLWQICSNYTQTVSRVESGRVQRRSCTDDSYTSCDGFAGQPARLSKFRALRRGRPAYTPPSFLVRYIYESPFWTLKEVYEPSHSRRGAVLYVLSMQ